MWSSPSSLKEKVENRKFWCIEVNNNEDRKLCCILQSSHIRDILQWTTFFIVLYKGLKTDRGPMTIGLQIVQMAPGFMRCGAWRAPEIRNPYIFIYLFGFPGFVLGIAKKKYFYLLCDHSVMPHVWIKPFMLKTFIPSICV